MSRALTTLTEFDPKIALVICEKVAAGLTLNEVLGQSARMPTRAQFNQWVLSNPRFSRAMEAARELSAVAFEEEALEMARSIAVRPGMPVRVRAFEVAMGQLRWSATRRDPAHFGERTQVSIRVPVQINTTLNLAPEGQGGLSTPDHANVYEIEAKPMGPVSEEGTTKVLSPTRRKQRRVNPVPEETPHVEE